MFINTCQILKTFFSLLSTLKGGIWGVFEGDGVEMEGKLRIIRKYTYVVSFP